MKRIYLLLIFILLVGCYPHGITLETDPEQHPPKPPDPPIRTYQAYIVSGGDVAGHDIKAITIHATECRSSYESEVFDGRKTPLLKVTCVIAYWRPYGMFRDEFWWLDDHSNITFEGLVDSYQIISTGE